MLLRSTLAGLASAVALVSFAGTTAPALALDRVPRKPCGSAYSLWATHAASAESYDANGDRLECRPRVDGGGDPYVEGRDNAGPLPLNEGYKLYSFADRPDRPTGVISVRKRANTFTAVTEGQEDDPDWNGCQQVCEQVLHYDRNDLFFIDTGRGSRLVTLRTFENSLAGTVRFSMIYQPRGRAAVNIFSLVKA